MVVNYRSGTSFGEACAAFPGSCFWHLLLMSLRLQIRRSPHPRGLAVFTAFAFFATLLPLYAGGFTTTIGAGMVFPDWPFSNGSLNPPGWTTDQAMAAEHGHRLLAATSGLLMIVLAVWMFLRESRGWLRRMAYLALGLVVLQGVLGGLRVLLVSVDLANVHGVLGQIYLGTVVAVAVGSSRWWQNLPRSFPETEDRVAWRAQRRWGMVLTGLLVGQLVIGSIVRHRGAGLAIPYFPASTQSGGLLPDAWNWAVAIHFAHRAMAVLITIVLIVWAWRLLRSRHATTMMRGLTWTAVALLVLQVGLGAEIIWSLRAPFQTTLHVLNGALLLSTVWAVTFAHFRPSLEGLEALATTATSDPLPITNSFAPQQS